jgi:hypothetical protein
MDDLRPRSVVAGPAAMAFAICVLVGGLNVLDGLDSGVVSYAARLLWWPAVFLWALSAALALRGRQGLWVAMSMPLVILPAGFYGLLVMACWKSCDL